MQVFFYTSQSGRSYVGEFLKGLTLDDRTTTLAVFEDIKRYGFGAVGCQFRQIEGKLWEIKIAARGGGYRFFYVLLGADRMMVLHAYRKQGQKAPSRELEVARKRMKEVL